MQKSTKGALAAAAAGSVMVGGGLMLGGGGSLASWNDTSDAPGVSITSGHLKLASPICGAWKLNAVDYVVSNLVKPGDKLTRQCTYTIDMEGTGLKAEFKATIPALTGTLAGALSTAGSKFEVAGGGPVAPATPTAVADGNTVTVNLEIAWADGGLPAGITSGDNAYNNAAGITAALADTTVSVTQVK